MKRIASSVLSVLVLNLGLLSVASAQVVRQPSPGISAEDLTKAAQGTGKGLQLKQEHTKSVTDAQNKKALESAEEEDKMRDPAALERREFEERASKANGIEPPNH